MLFTVATQQKEEQRQKLLEEISNEIQASLDREDFDQAQGRITRALESLPGEGLLVRLQVEIASRKRDFDTRQAVRAAMLRAQELFVDHPEQALQAIENGLEQAPGDETLLQSRARLGERLRNNALNAARNEALLKAQAALETKKYAEARRVLDEAIGTLGPNEDFEHLLAITKRGQSEQEQKSAQVRDALFGPNKSEAPTPFAGAAMQAAHVSSKQESWRVFPAKPALLSALRKFRTSMVFLVGGALVLLSLATTLLLRLRYREASANKNPVIARVPAAAAVPTFMEINASPWARVLQVQDGEGASIRLPENGTTPLRLDDLKAGQYKVTLAGPNGDQRIMNCSISDSDHLCMLQIEAPDIRQVVTGANP